MEKFLSVASCFAMADAARKREERYSRWLKEAGDNYRKADSKKERIKAFLVIVVFALGKSVARLEKVEYRGKAVKKAIDK